MKCIEKLIKILIDLINSLINDIDYIKLCFMVNKIVELNNKLSK